MKKYLLLTLWVALCAPAFSQQWRIAPTLGVNLSTISFSSYYQNSLFTTDLSTGTATRGQFGALIDYTINDRISVRSGLFYTAKGSSLQYSATQYSYPLSIPGAIRINYFDIPLLVSIALGESGFRLIGGPVLGIALNGKFSREPIVVSGIKIEGSEYKMSVGTSFYNSLLPTDLSLNLGLIKQFELASQFFELGIHIQPSVSSFDPATKQNSKYSATNFLVGLKASYVLPLSQY